MDLIKVHMQHKIRTCQKLGEAGLSDLAHAGSQLAISLPERGLTLLKETETEKNAQKKNLD